MRRTRWMIVLCTGCLLAACAPDQESPDPRSSEPRSDSAGTGDAPVPRRSEPGKGEAPDPRPTALRRIEAGSYRSFFPGKDEPKRVAVAAFRIEEHAVTNDQFARFVRAEPRWRRSRVKRLFADKNYLRHWQSDVDPGAALRDRPVVHVSWFAARAYAQWIGRRLPTLHEWELVAAASKTSVDGTAEPGYNQRVLDWYAKTTSVIPEPVRSTFQNVHGVFDMHGLVWEWVENFNTALVTGESRGDTGLERTLFCGAGSIGAANPADYASFMRFAFRSSLEASYTTKNLGFRCAVDLPEKGPQ